MKWIGQHIWDLAARFRNDVFLESISTGTIASGGNLGLDSNNKIVKATAAAGDITGVDLTASTGIDLTSVSGATGGDYAATIGVDVSDFMSSGSEGRVLTSATADTILANTYLTFVNTDNISSLTLYSNEDMGDYCQVATTTHGATTLYTVDDDSSAANLYFDIDGDITMDSQPARFNYFKAGNTDDFLQLTIGDNGDAMFTTVDAAATAAHFEIAADGDITLDAAGQIKLEPGTSVLWDSVALTGIQTSAESFSNDDVSLMTSAAIEDKILAYGYTANTGNITFNLGGVNNYMVTASSSTTIQGEQYIQAFTASNVTRMNLFSDEDTGDMLNIAVTTHGATSFTTTDDDAAAAHFEIDADGDIILDANGQVKLEPASGSDILLDGTISIDAGVVTGATSVATTEIELGHASDTTFARSAAGVATIESNIIQTKNKIIHLEQGTLSDNIVGNEHFFPAVTTSESESFTNVVTPFLMPVAGKLLKIHLKANQNHNTSSNEITFKLYDLDDGENWNDANKTLLGTKVISGTAKATVMIADFQDLTTTGASGTNAFQAGDLIGISLQNSQNLNITTKYVWTFVFELDFNSY